MSTTENERMEHRLALEEVRKQVMMYGKQFQEYLEHMNQVHAEIESYKFSVEKRGDGIEVEIQLKAYIHPKTNEAAKVIPK